MNDFIIKGPDGKPIFTGKEDPNNTLAKPNKGSQIECPICHNMVDYLLGNIRKGCEMCYDKSKDEDEKAESTYDSSKQIL